MVELCDKCGNPFPMGGWFQCPDHGKPHGGFSLDAHPSERAVVHRNLTTGKISYPPRNDTPTPAGYVREELPNLRAIHKLEAQEGVRSDVAWFDKGSGHADHMPEHKPIDLTGLEFGTLD